MNKKFFKDCILIMLYCALLVVVLVKLNSILEFLNTILSLLIPFFIGIIIAFFLNKPHKIIYKGLCHLFTHGREHRICKALSIILVYVLFFSVIVAIISFIIPLLSESIHALIMNMEKYYSNLNAFLENIQSKYNLEIFDVDALTKSFTILVEKTMGLVGTYSTQIIQFTTGVFSGIANIIIGIVFSIYLLVGKASLKLQIKSIFTAYMPASFSNFILKTGRMAIDIYENFISVTLTEAFVSGILCFTGMSIFSFDYAVLISTIIGILNVIPLFGPIIGGAVSLAIILIVSPDKALMFAIFFIILTQVENTFIYPKVLRKSSELPGLWVIASVVFFGGAFNIIGMIFAVPTAAILYKLLFNKINARLHDNQT